MYDLRVEVQEVRGFCDLPHRPGDYFEVRAGKLFVPAGKFVCIWALSAMLPMLAAKEREIVEPNDWMPHTDLVTCPDPNGRVVWRVRRVRAGAVAAEHADSGRLVPRMLVEEGRCNSCGACVQACPSVPALIRLPGPLVCRQCGVARCVTACPQGALSRHEATRAVRADHERCTGCGECAGVCAFGGPLLLEGKAWVCDLCGGSPACAAACPTGALIWSRGGIRGAR